MAYNHRNDNGRFSRYIHHLSAGHRDYSYTVGPTSYDGIYKREYWSREDAETFARNLLAGSPLKIRYRSETPTESVLREEDQ